MTQNREQKPDTTRDEQVLFGPFLTKLYGNQGLLIPLVAITGFIIAYGGKHFGVALIQSAGFLIFLTGIIGIPLTFTLILCYWELRARFGPAPLNDQSE